MEFRRTNGRPHDGRGGIGWPVERPRGTTFVWAPLPEPYREMGPLNFAKRLVTETHVGLSPRGVGCGPGRTGSCASP